MSDASPIFSKMYDFMRWVIPVTNKFPRQQRFVLAKALQESTFFLHQELIFASKLENSVEHLQLADAALAQVRTYLRLSHEMQYVNPGQYEHAARILVEIGKLLGGWMRSIS